MNTRILIAVLLVPLAALAQVNVNKAHYSLSFNSHWSTSLIPTMDTTTVAVMDTAHAAFAWAHGVPATPGMTSAQYIQIMTAAYQSQFTRTDSSTKQLGGYTFITTGWKDLDTSSGDSAARLRIYALDQGGVYFIAWLMYETPEGDPALAEFEAALATLQIRNVGTRPLASAGREPVPGMRRVDLLGRVPVPAARQARGAYIAFRP